MSDLTETVREALAKATPGPWEYEEPDGRHGADPSIGSAAEYISPFFGSKEDGDLIIHAPAWLAELCDRLDAAEAAVPRIKAEAWDERDRARPSYLGPDHGHYKNCMGYEDCYCGTYPNPYSE